MKIDIKKSLPIILFVSVLILIAVAFTVLRPQERPPEFNKADYEQTVVRIEDMPGISGVKRFSDAAKNVPTNKTVTNRTSTRINRTREIVLPYPRISINYVIRKVTMIQNESAGDNKTFVLVNLDIKNHGYEYFDAHPKKFRLAYTDAEYLPIVTLSTGNMLDEVLPNGSRTKGDLIFLLDKKKASSAVPKIKHIDGGYTTVYNQEGVRRRTWSSYGYAH